MTNDSISDFLNRINNAQNACVETIILPYSKVTAAIAKVLESEGYISNVYRKEEERIVTAKVSGPKKFEKMVRVSKPGRRVYARSSRIPRPKSCYGVAVLSTSSGILTGDKARKAGIGGEVIFEVF